MNTIKLSLVLSLFGLLFGTSSCVDELFLEGNGNLRTESRGASGFEEITSSGDFDVTIVPGSSYSVEVSAESNLLSYIETDVVGKTLKIRTRGVHSLRLNYPIEVYITTPVLNGLALSGSGIIKTGSFLSDDFKIAISGSGDIDTEISTDKMKVSISGSGTVFLEGDATETEFVVSGSGKIKAYNFPHRYCQATISGSGDMYVNASHTIDARISGSGRVFYINHPVIHTSISGSGEVVDKN
ncbi:MAG: head GIN domain-containing protein [Bacteroidota bacterium]|nr:head GIN domain-containing protein [Bacteroidota bacterium]